MPDSERPQENGIERELRDLGARIEYPPTPDLARAIRHRLDEREERRSTARGFWPSLLSSRWAVPAAALVLICLALLSPAVRAPLSDLLFSGQTASSGGAGGPASRPEPQAKAGPGSSEVSDADGSREEAMPESGGGGSTAAESSMAESAGGEAARGGATGCPAPYLGVEPARVAPGATLRLLGKNFTADCDRIRPAQDVRIYFSQDGKTWRLATVDADRRLAFEVRLRIPEGAEPGRATVRATTPSGERTEERFEVLGR